MVRALIAKKSNEMFDLYFPNIQLMARFIHGVVSVGDTSANYEKYPEGI